MNIFRALRREPTPNALTFGMTDAEVLDIAHRACVREQVMERRLSLVTTEQLVQPMYEAVGAPPMDEHDAMDAAIRGLGVPLELARNRAAEVARTARFITGSRRAEYAQQWPDGAA